MGRIVIPQFTLLGSRFSVRVQVRFAVRSSQFAVRSSKFAVQVRVLVRAPSVVRGRAGVLNPDLRTSNPELGTPKLGTPNPERNLNTN